MRQCPRCRVPFESRKGAFVEIDVCPRCGGLYFDAHETIAALGGAYDPETLLRGGSARVVGVGQLECPGRHDEPVRMSLLRVGEGERALELDVCMSCGGSFFDAGEAEALKELDARIATITRPSGASFAAPPANPDAHEAALDAVRAERGKSLGVVMAEFFADGARSVGTTVTGGPRPLLPQDARSVARRRFWGLE